MTAYLLIALLLFTSVVLAFADWRKAVLLCLIVGIVQDPIRKLLPAQPVMTQLLVLGCFGIALAGIVFAGYRVTPRQIYGNNRSLIFAGNLLVAVVILQVFHTLLRYGNPVLAGLGVLTYFAPLLAATVGYIYARHPQDIIRFIRVYLWIAVPVCLTVYLSYWYPGQYDLLREVGEFVGRRLVIYDLGTVMYSYSGLLRVGEVAAWHSAMCCIFLFIWANRSNKAWSKILAGLLFVALVGAILLTGRRKMLIALVVFLGFYVFFIAWFWRFRRRMGVSSLAVGAIVALFVWAQFPDVSVSPYLQRGQSVFTAAPDRIETSQNLFRSAIFRAGILGKGAGVSAQGAQYFGGGEKIVGGAAEAGAGKIYVELGMAGFVAILWLVWKLRGHFAILMRRLGQVTNEDTTLYAGLLAAIMANAVTFFAATQLFGDMFVQLILGMMAGMCLSAAKPFMTASVAGTLDRRAGVARSSA